MVTQIIPIRFVEARQLVSDLSSFVSAQATVVANEAGNSIVITDTQANIHHLAEIIKAVDDSAEAETEIQVFPLKYANPTDVATELGNIFPSSTSGNTTQSPIRFGGGFPGGGGGGGFLARMMAANAGASGANSSSDRIKKATQVSAVADLRTSSVIVTAPKDLMDQIAGMMEKLDVPSDRDQDVYVYKLNNGDPQQVAQVLQNTFGAQRSSSGTTGANLNSALQQRAQNNTQQMGSQSTGSGFGTGGGIGGGGGRTGALP
jgi:general secretion pathway protein D